MYKKLFGFGLAAAIALNAIAFAGKIPSFRGEDIPHVNGDSGAQILGVRNDDLAALAGTDGDYAPVQLDANGAVYVNMFTDGAPAVSYTASVTATGSVDAGANRIYAINYCNADATDAHSLKIYDKATAATQTDAPIFKTRALANTCTNVSIPGGIPIALGISLRATAENADSGTTAASANESSATLLLAD